MSYAEALEKYQSSCDAVVDHGEDCACSLCDAALFGELLVAGMIASWNPQ